MVAEETKKEVESLDSVESLHSLGKDDYDKTTPSVNNEPKEQTQEQIQTLPDGGSVKPADELPTGWGLAAILLACYLAMFLVALVGLSLFFLA